MYIELVWVSIQDKYKKIKNSNDFVATRHSRQTASDILGFYWTKHAFWRDFTDKVFWSDDFYQLMCENWSVSKCLADADKVHINAKICVFMRMWLIGMQQGKSEGFESCDRPIVRKRPIWVKIGDVLYHVTLKFDGWPWKTIGHLSFAVSSFVQHFIAIGEFKLELLSGNAQFGSNLTIFRAAWPWNLTYDLENP